MNIENVKKAIKVIERAEKCGHPLNMAVWQDNCVSDVCETWEELHSCGTPACFAGLISVSPEFQNDGGSVDSFDGVPIFMKDNIEHFGHNAIQEWLDINEHDAESLCFCLPSAQSLYKKYSAVDVSIHDVLNVLYRLESTGSIWPKEEITT